MAPLSIPDDGLHLQGVSSFGLDAHLAPDAPQPQVMRLDLAGGVFEDIVKASRMGKDIHMSFGKNIIPRQTIHYGNKTQQLLSIAQPTQSELYKYSPDKEDQLHFAGTLTHKLAQKKVEENTAGADAALAALQSKMASHQQNKQSKQIKVLSQTPTPSPSLKSTHPNPRATNFFANLKSQQTRKPMTSHGNTLARSTPGSPAAAPSHPGQATSIPPRSAPAAQDEKSQKLQALKIPLLHLVAIRPMSLKFLANKLGCSQDECRQVLEKIGKPARLDPDKWDLSDKAFKELDVWKFAYELENDRELAIEHAVSAYDRMRLSREDKLWQMLLPKAERGKGKVLSKLQLHQGPIQKSSTPKIHVQRTTEDQVNDNTPNLEGEERHHLTPADATPMARSQSSDQMKRKRVNEQEAQSKRLLSTKPKKASASPKAIDAPKKKVTKKGSASAPNVKSTEFVHDSDEDGELEAVVNAAPKPAPTLASQPTTKTASRLGPKSTVAKTPEAGPKGLAKTAVPDKRDSIKQQQQTEKDGKRVKTPSATDKPGSDGSKRATSGAVAPSGKHRLSDASQSSSSTSKVSRQRTTSSPLKPSPLGSSPPTNASDLENDRQPQATCTSSNSSTPLIGQARSTPLSAKAGIQAAKRLPEAAQNTSEHSLKRKADDVDSDLHSHNVPLTNGQISPAAKRIRRTVPSPRAMDSSSSESSPISSDVIHQAKRFKEYYANYERLYGDLSAQTTPAVEKVDRLVKMHNRLRTMKDEINRASMRG
ncbi:MAG: hypothetical protein LQ348_002190 [Seirophora lacunosa]|nr:MAG: hypothetical protein LQ348_002190 [Seirophora lacunosa]